MKAMIPNMAADDRKHASTVPDVYCNKINPKLMPVRAEYTTKRRIKTGADNYENPNDINSTNPMGANITI